MRRCHLRGRENILKRQLAHVSAFNLSLPLHQTQMPDLLEFSSLHHGLLGESGPDEESTSPKEVLSMPSSDVKYIGLDVHKEAITIAVLNGDGKLVMESVIETKASTLVQFLDGLRGELHVTLEEGTWAAWLYDVLKPHVREIVVCNPRRN